MSIPAASGFRAAGGSGAAGAMAKASRKPGVRKMTPGRRAGSSRTCPECNLGSVSVAEMESDGFNLVSLSRGTLQAGSQRARNCFPCLLYDKGGDGKIQALFNERGEACFLCVRP